MDELLKGAGNIMEALANSRGHWGVRVSKSLDVRVV